MKRVLPIGALAVLCVGASGGFRRGKPESVVIPTSLRLLPGGVPASQTCAGTLVGSGQAAVTVTRATTKSCTQADAGIVLMDAGLPDVETAGLLVEAAHTNLALRSQQIDNAAWDKLGSSSAPTVTADQTAAPDGTTTAEKVTSNQATTAANSYDIVRPASGITVSNGATYTFSIWLKAGTATAAIVYINAGTTAAQGTQCALTSAWTRCVATIAVAATTAYPSFGWTQDSVQSSGSGLTFYAWGAQFETGAYVHSYVPTTTASVTGNKDAVVVTASRLPVAHGEIDLVFTPLWSTSPTTATLIDTRNSTPANGLGFYIASGKLSFAAENATALQSSALTWTAGTSYTLRARWSGGNIWLFRNGTQVVSATAGTATMPAAHNTFRIGDGYNTSSPLDGYIRALTVSP